MSLPVSATFHAVLTGTGHDAQAMAPHLSARGRKAGVTERNRVARGMRQRAVIARAIAVAPVVFLADPGQVWA